MDRETKIYEEESLPILYYESQSKELLLESIQLSTSSTPQPQETTFLKSPITIGALPKNDFAISEDPYLSGNHAIIEKQGKTYWLKDRESRNGVWIDGKPVQEIPLQSHGEFLVGKTLIQYQLDIAKEKIRPYTKTKMGTMIGRSPAIKEVFSLIHRIAPSRVPICLIGESGTGKELAAQAIHDRSLAAEGPFVAINCGAFPKHLIESELFGHEKGSFTGATERKMGVFELAHRGTLFLDEIGEMPLELQTRLLRVLETGKVRHIGGASEIPVQVRIIAATHRDLTKLVMNKQFREDLFYRLYVVPIKIPPLRERRKDIPLLVHHFLEMFRKEGTKKTFTHAALRKLVRQPWVGNVRELKNVIQRAIFLTVDDVIDEADLLPLLPPSSHKTPGKESLRHGEKESIIQMLKDCNGNVTLAAKKLGIARTTLHSKMRKFHLRELGEF